MTRAQIEEAIVTLLRGSERFNRTDVANTVGVADDREFRLALHAATERLRDELGHVYVPRGGAGTYMRGSAKQKRGRASRFLRAANRKIVRADSIVQTIDESEVSPEDRARLGRTKEKFSQMASRAISSYSRRGEDPPAQRRAVDVPRGKDLPGQGLLRQGAAGRGETWFGKGLFTDRLRTTRRDFREWHVEPWFGLAGRGRVGQPKGFPASRSKVADEKKCSLWPGWLGKFRRGGARRG